MTERRRLSDEQLKTLDALITEVARRNIAKQGRTPLEEWSDEADAIADIGDDAVFEIGPIVAGGPDVGGDPGEFAIQADGGDILDLLPARVAERFRAAGPMPSLEDLILIRRNQQ
jgi:hypothetical protein